MSEVFIAFCLGFASLFFIYTMLALALNLQWGQAGVMNFGIVGFYALGAYITAILMVDPTTLAHLDVGFSLSFPAALPIVLIGAGVLAWVISPLVKLGVEELAIITIAFGQVVNVIAANETWLTGGTLGITYSSYFNENLGAMGYNGVFALILGASAFFIYYFTRKLNLSQFGRILNAIRQDELKAKSLGIDVVSYKVKAFIIGSVIMALAGSFSAFMLLRVIPGLYPVSLTFAIWTALLLGGSGNNLGAVLGVGIYMLIDILSELFLKIPSHPEIEASLPLVIIGVLLVVIMVRRPKGILGPKRSRYD